VADRERGTSDDGRATIARLADEIVPTLIERLGRSQLAELEVRENGWRVRLRRPVANGAAQPPRSSGAAAAPSTGHRPAPAHGAPRDSGRGLVTSPAVGYFTPRHGVDIGARLRAGDLVGHVDVLGVRHEVAVDGAGVLRAWEVEPGQAVEYGQPVARLEPES
jgi:acetyl-CoA carboxylase biotin carboxyl carrier protein